MALTDELKPCPFCLGEASIGTVKYAQPDKEWGQDTFFYANCVHCGSNNKPIIGFKTQQKAVAHWNTRPIEDGLRAEFARKDELIAALRDVVAAYDTAVVWMNGEKWRCSRIVESEDLEVARARLREVEGEKYDHTQ